MPARLPILFAGLACLLCVSPVPAMIDANGDGVSDVWVARFGGGLPPTADPDGDGLTNRDEAVAGTDPHDGGSRLVVGRFARPSPDSALIEWSSVPGKRYRIQASADLTRWIDLPAVYVGDGAEIRAELALNRLFESGDFAVARWDAMPGDSRFPTLKNYVASGTPAPSRILSLPSLALPQSDPNAEQFGHHATGWLVPPADGAYRFFVASDDNSEFWLSPSADPAARVLVASVPSWTNADEWNRFPEQRSVAIPLLAGRAYAFEFFHHEGYGGDHFAIAWTGPGLDPDKEVIQSRYLARDPRSLAERLGPGRGFFRITVEDQDSDGDGATDHEEEFLGLNPHDPTTTPRVADGLAVAQRLAARDRLSLGATSSRAYETGAIPARLTIFRSGNIGPVTVRYDVTGDARSGLDYQTLSGAITLPAGAASVELTIPPLMDSETEAPESVVITLLPDPAYDLGSPTRTAATIDDAPDELYLASLRPVEGVRSGAWGSATLRAAGNGLSAAVSLALSGLGAPQTDARLYISNTGAAGPDILALPAGQIDRRPWAFEPAAGQSSAAILAALREGRLWARVNSSVYPDGEILGRFTLVVGSSTMAPVPLPPVVPSGAPTAAQASRFLDHATFGPTPAQVAAVQAGGYAAWINTQLALPATPHLPYVQARRAELAARDPNDTGLGWQTPRQHAWWQRALTAPDQLRQRMAWALSQILVISQDGALDGSHEEITAYYDLLLAHAFGNYRDLLGDVTRSPVMGVYLSMIRNQPPDPETGQRPDENYAREIMQLFTIGLNQLHADGTLRLDAEGRPQPTYTQADIAGLASVFTGWGPHYDDADPPRWYWDPTNIADRRDWFLYGDDRARPMTFYPEFHDPAAKTILGGITIPAGFDGAQAMNLALDALFQHPNTGPFLGRQLIQRFVTSNPSPGYVHRVASAFADDGTGVRGNLAATLRAVLLDPEALSEQPLADAAFGKRREPVLRLTRFLRAFPPAPARAGDDRFFISYQYSLPHQIPQLSPSVFNFYQPVYAHPGRIAAAGLVSPEFQITSETTVVREANEFDSAIFWGLWTGELLRPSAPYDESTNPYLILHPDFSAELALLERTGFSASANQSALLDALSLKLLDGRLTPGLRADLQAAFAALPGWFFATSDPGLLRERRLQLIGLAIHVIALSPEAVISR